ncbi:hypothetical protein PINS_up015370 [Pythium insidiosum]|nr:hypothetical protein PINS_up015370 [Pythium insidiosum]
MARKQFVSSKKNAPSRVVPSKEAALRASAAEPQDSDQDTAGGDDSPLFSSPLSSDDRDDVDDEDDNDEGDATESAAVAVQVMPSSVGRGKQLRFPTMISRGKESRVLINGSDGGNESEDSDNSYLSVHSDDDEDGEEAVADDQDRRMSMGDGEQPEETATPMDVQSPEPRQLESPEADASYPIKAFRARKRHRPDSGYFKQMSTHVRDCLLSVRDSSTAADVFRDDIHVEFRRKLSCGAVERVQWKEAVTPPASSQPKIQPAEVEKKERASSMSSAARDESTNGQRQPQEPRAKEKPPSESRSHSKSSSSTKKDSASSPSSSSTRKTDAPKSPAKSESRSHRDSSSRKDRSREGSSSSSRDRDRERDRERERDRDRERERDRAREKDKEKAKPRQESMSSSSKADAAEKSNGSADTQIAATASERDQQLCSNCKKSLAEDRSESPAKKPPLVEAVHASTARARRSCHPSWVVHRDTRGRERRKQVERTCRTAERRG